MAPFRPWIERFPANVEVCLVQLPGRETRMREVPYSLLNDLVADLARALDPLLDQPYALFGHSMGALIGFALAHHLRSLDRPQPVHLFVSARRPPHLPDADAPLHQLPDAALVAALVRRYNGIPRVLLEDAELLRLFLPTLRADLTMLETYPYVERSPLECPITAFGGWEDSRVTQVDLAAWSNLTGGHFAAQMFPGGHFFLQSEREALIAAMVEGLASHARQPASRWTGLPVGEIGAGIVERARAAD
jgi:surfactin synthase thioesterase subunit